MITPQEAKQFMDTQDCIILDVRYDYEYNEKHIENAINVPMPQINEKAESLLPDKNALILVYCRTGKRAQMACTILKSLGYTNTHDFGGILDWPY